MCVKNTWWITSPPLSSVQGALNQTVLVSELRRKSKTRGSGSGCWLGSGDCKAEVPERGQKQPLLPQTSRLHSQLGGEWEQAFRAIGLSPAVPGQGLEERQNVPSTHQSQCVEENDMHKDQPGAREGDGWHLPSCY